MLFERQRCLLAFLAALGGAEGNRDFQKLLFLWSQELGTAAPYDFVPFRFGAFSHTSHADRRKLITNGFLEDVESRWVLAAKGRDALARPSKLGQRAKDFAARTTTLRGDALVAHTYRLFPFFAIRSEIAASMLTNDADALAAIEEARPLARPPGIVSIGYEGRSLEGYLVRLLEAGVGVLCDVRRNPLSRRYGFSRSTLSTACEGVGIRYEHMPELGIASEDRRGLETQADYDALFAVYERDALPLQTASLARIASWVEAGARVALTCYESLPQQCHRRCVAESLEGLYGAKFAAAHL